MNEKLIKPILFINGLLLILFVIWTWAYINKYPINNIYILGIILSIFIIWSFIICAILIHKETSKLKTTLTNLKTTAAKQIFYIGMMVLIIAWESILLWEYIKNNYCISYNSHYPLIGTTFEWFVWPMVITIAIFNGLIIYYLDEYWLGAI